MCAPFEIVRAETGVLLNKIRKLTFQVTKVFNKSVEFAIYISRISLVMI